MFDARRILADQVRRHHFEHGFGGTLVAFPGLDFTRKELTVVGSRASTNCFPEALHLLASGAIRYPQVASPFALWDAPAIFARLADDPGAVHKGVLMVT